jgi:hypothetical protein
MIQAMDTAGRQGLQKDLRAFAANIRADTEGRYGSADPGWQAGLEWTLLPRRGCQQADHGKRRGDLRGKWGRSCGLCNA